jgi:DNA-binding protein
MEDTKKTPTDNIINVSSRRGSNFYVYLTKKYLNDFDEVELHSIGNAMTMAVETAENLEK